MCHLFGVRITADGVCHEIRPIIMRCLISNFSPHEHQSVEVKPVEFSSLTKSELVCDIFSGLNSR